MKIYEDYNDGGGEYCNNDHYTQTCKSVYDRVIELKIASPQIILNYATYLEEKNYFEESFKVIDGCVMRKRCWKVV